MRILPLAGSSLVAVSVFVLAPEREAHAGDFAIGADVHAAVPFGASSNPSTGIGFDGRLGYRLGLGPVWIQPEVLGGFVTIDPAQLTRFGGGARLGLGGLIQPSIFAHGGYGTINVGGGGYRVDGGLALDIKVPYVSFGAHVGYNINGTDGDAIQYISAGGQVTLLL